MKTIISGKRSAFLLLAGILLLSTNLRAPFTAVGPVLEMISNALHLSATQAGILTALPLLAFALVSPFATLFARKFGLERALFAALLIIALGIALRSTPVILCLYLGTALLGAGIAIGNVLLPSLIKRDFPNSISRITIIYSMVMGLVAAISSIIIVPVAENAPAGWSFALGMLIILPLLSAILWLPQLKNHTAPAPDATPLSDGGPIWKSALAWQVTLFMGLNSFIYYIGISWFPAILTEAGYSASEAGGLHGLMQLATSIIGLILLPIVSRAKDQRAIAFSMAILVFTGFAGLLLMPDWAAIWVFIFGLGSGASFILALSFVSLRASNSRQAASLSGMAQSVGYSMAAIGPTLAGLLHDRVGTWHATLLLCAVLCLIMAVLGLFAGRAIELDSVASNRRVAA